MLAQIERRVLADRQALHTAAISHGANGVELPTFSAAQDEFDESLAREPERASPKLAMLRRWGVA